MYRRGRAVKMGFFYCANDVNQDTRWTWGEDSHSDMYVLSLDLPVKLNTFNHTHITPLHHHTPTLPHHHTITSSHHHIWGLDHLECLNGWSSASGPSPLCPLCDHLWGQDSMFICYSFTSAQEWRVEGCWWPNASLIPRTSVWHMHCHTNGLRMRLA